MSTLIRATGEGRRIEIDSRLSFLVSDCELDILISAAVNAGETIDNYIAYNVLSPALERFFEQCMRHNEITS